MQVNPNTPPPPPLVSFFPIYLGMCEYSNLFWVWNKTAAQIKTP